MSTTKKVTRRLIMSGAAALPAVAVLPAVSAEATIELDPITEAYDVVLADLRAKRDQVDQTIKNLEAAREGETLS